MLVEDLIARRPDIRLLTARDGNRGIEIARASLPDVILMDINLPGISGIQALKVLAQDAATARIPVVALSANAVPRDIARGMEAGFFRYLTKPIKVNEFMATLDVGAEIRGVASRACRRSGAIMNDGTLDILGARILVVDDQEANVQLLEQLLGDAGYTCVASTMNPQEVCALHRKNCYDLILLDLQMPGMDGFAVMAGLKSSATESYLPVIVLTAQPGHKLRALQAGAKDFISKPFDLVEAKTRIHNMLEVRLLYRKLEGYTRELEQAVQERTAELRESEARYRSLTELASDWYWEQDETGSFTRVSGPVLEMLGIRVEPLAGRSERRRNDRLERGRAEGAAGKDCRAAAIHRPGPQSRQCRWLTPAVPGERGADVQPGLPLHRLPRHRRGNHGRAIGRKPAARRNANTPQSCARTICSPVCPRRTSGGWLRTWNSFRCRSAKCSTSPASSCSTPISPPPRIVSLHYVLESGATAESAGVGNEGVVGIALFMGGETTSSSAVVQTGGHAYRLAGRLLKQEFDRAGLMHQSAAALHPGTDHAGVARRRSATGTIRWSNNCAAGCCEPSIGRRRVSWS